MKGKDKEVRRIVRLMNLPSYELELNLVPEEGTKMTCPPEVESMIASFYQTINVEKMHREGKLCHILLPIELHELLVPLETHYLLLGPFILKAMDQKDTELLLLNANLDPSPVMIEYFQTLSYLSPSRFSDLTELFSDMLNADTETVTFLSNSDSETLMKRILLSESEEEIRERAGKYYIECARALSFREMEKLDICGEKWSLFIENAPLSSFPLLKEMVYNEYILMCSTYHETVHYEATPFIAYLRKKLDASTTAEELASFHREMLSVFKEHLDMDDPITLPPTIRKVRQYIRIRYKENIKLNDLAKEVNLSPNYLSSTFFECCNTTITDYILSCRIEQAKRLLLYSTLPIGDIAGLCGFVDASYFTKRFKKVESVLPEEYRRTHAVKVG